MAARTDRPEIMAALRASAVAHGGTPCWSEVAKLHGIDRKTLREWWADGGEHSANYRKPTSAPPPRRPQLTVHAGGGDVVEIGEVDGPPATEVEYWNFRWRQLAITIRDCETFSAMPPLLKQQDEIWFKRRAALAEEGNADVTPEEGAARIMQLVDAMPDGLLMQVAAVVRRRGIMA